MLLQVYELDAFKVTHVSKYPAPVMSVAISANAALLAVGMADGQLSVRKHSHNKGPAGGALLSASQPLLPGPFMLSRSSCPVAYLNWDRLHSP